MKKTGKKYAKPIIIAAVCLIIVIIAAAILPNALIKNAVSTRITTYNVDAITYGNVSQTISGSGTLTPVTKETLTSSAGGEVTQVNFTVGDEVAADDEVSVSADSIETLISYPAISDVAPVISLYQQINL